jgi:hypothetical protein
MTRVIIHDKDDVLQVYTDEDVEVIILTEDERFASLYKPGPEQAPPHVLELLRKLRADEVPTSGD